MTEHQKVDNVEENEAEAQIQLVEDFQQMGLDSRILEVSIFILNFLKHFHVILYMFIFYLFLLLDYRKSSFHLKIVNKLYI